MPVGVKSIVTMTRVSGSAFCRWSRASQGTAEREEGAERSRGSSGVRGTVQRASKRGEPILAAAWDAARDNLEPLTRTGARKAGRFVAERSPEFVRETVIPPFVEGLNEGRNASKS
jgi:hypothetical protein